MVLPLIIGGLAASFAALFIGSNFIQGLQYTLLHLLFLVLGVIAAYVFLSKFLQPQATQVPLENFAIVGVLAIGFILLGVPNFIFATTGMQQYSVVAFSVALPNEFEPEITAWFEKQKQRQAQALPCENQGICVDFNGPAARSYAFNSQCTATPSMPNGNVSITPPTESYATCYAVRMQFDASAPNYVGIPYNYTFVDLGGSAQSVATPPQIPSTSSNSNISPQPATEPARIPSKTTEPSNWMLGLLLSAGALVFAWKKQK